MSKDGKPSDGEDALDKLLAGDVEGFDTALQKQFRGPSGTDLREAHLVELIATKLFAGDHVKATRLMDVPTLRLDGQTMREAASTHQGMIEAKELIGVLEAAGFTEGELAIADAANQLRIGETSLLLDLLPAAWGMNDHEFEYVLRVSPGWMRAWRNHEVGVSHAVRARLRRLRQFQGALALITRPNGLAEAWRRPWAPASPIGKRSIWQAYQDDGDAVLDLVQAYCLSAR